MKALAIAFVVLLSGCLEQRAYRVVEPPRTRSMIAGFVLGDWQSNFGEISIDSDDTRGGIVMGAVTGTWTYWNPTTMREVKGHFHGTMRGSVLRLTWVEGVASGHGFLEFAPNGQSYSGQWWNLGRTKTGEWRGWRSDARGDV